MSRRSLLGFLFLNIIVTFATVFLIIKVYSSLAPQGTPKVAVPPIVVMITNTPDPRGAEKVFVVVTATPGSVIDTNPGAATPDLSGTEAAGLPTNDNTIPTLDPALLPPSLGTVDANALASGTSTGPGNGCQTYTIKQGDTAGGIATVFGVTLDNLMRANNLTDADLPRLQIGQTLTIPVNGCGISTEEPTATITPTRLVLPTAIPSATLAPTASQAQVDVTQVIGPGDITSEGVELRNISGGVIQMKGWTLTNTAGQKFTFPDYRMFPGGRVTVYTRAGTNTPIVLYWGQSRAAWGGDGEQVSVADDKGEIQTTYAVAGGPATLPSGNGGAVPTPTAGG